MTSEEFDPSLVPELLVSNVSRSIDFWCGLCGFEIAYERPEEGFAYITRGSAHIMLEQKGIGRNWVTGPLERPFGRGINFQIAVLSMGPIEKALNRASYPLFMPPETKWYRIGDFEEAGVRQLLVTDPDGYLVRFQEPLGRRTPQQVRDSV
ncbi:MAG: bleomycin resistance protein [Brevibacterium aurantiacum]|uniref:bleomycin resistance protein n=1 Tax=Brevibacterium aurantiacum TaxID=273384 RepID=UPI001865A3CD|nr:VOC family protein [Brevibacterium aurantiacum]